VSYQYYTYLTDDEVRERIKRLSPNQQKEFEKCMMEVDDFRAALFVASSYPIEEKSEDKNK
jgi:hypothetical protein